MNINTKTKIAIAASISKVVRFTRSIFGLRNEDVFCRNKIRWHLDLSQGIDFAIFLQGGFEPSAIRSYNKYVTNGCVVFDIGANIGAHTLPLASLVGEEGRVIAFEPTDYAYTKLIKNLKLNPELARRTIPIQAMLIGHSQEAKPVSIPSSWSLDTDSVLDTHPVHGGTYQSLEMASVFKLDDWFQDQNLKRLDFVKIDVDGYEIDVFEGAMNVFSKYSPAIMMEFMPYIFEERGRSFSELLEILRSLNYTCHIIGGPEISLDSSVLQHIPQGGSINVILMRSSQ